MVFLGSSNQQFKIMKKVYFKAIITFLFICNLATIHAQAKIDCQGSGELCDFFRHYIYVFNDRDWKGFSNCLADDITVMFDSHDKPDRKNGRAEVEQMFRFLFPQPGTPLNQDRFQIIPADLLIQDLGDAAIISFNIKSPSQLARRSLVLQKRKGNWLIVHMHASSFASGGN